MDEEDLVPQRQPPKPKDLTLMGIVELEEYIATLDAEILEREWARGRAMTLAEATEAALSE